MIQEDYVSLETAKLLKEKGYDWECQIRRFYPKDEFDEECPDGVEAPTLQTVMKWLREVHNIDIDITAQVGMLQVKRYVPNIKTYNPKFDEELGKNRLNQKSHSTSKPLKGEILPVYEDFATYEQACEAAIKYCLENLI